MATRTRDTPKPSFDRTPPHSLDAERAVLGAMLLNPDAVGTGIEVLRENAEDVFYVEAHQHLYNAMVRLFRDSTPVDGTTLVSRLERDGTLEASGGVSYIGELTTAVPTSANIEYYARIVLEAGIQRRLITICSQLAGEAYTAEAGVEALLDKAESDIFRIAEQRQLHPIHKVADLVDDGIERIDKQMREGGGISGLATGFTKMDEMLSGFQPSDMVVLAARPSVGKTAFSLNIASHVANRLGKGALFFSLEMSKEQLVQRLICMEGQVNAARLRTGFLAKGEFPKALRAADTLKNSPFYIDDTPNIGMLELRSKARRHAAQNPVDIIFIDYLQLMSGGGRAESRQVEIAEISRAVKGIARELSVPVIALSQLSREAEKDDSGSPKLSHLRESGAIEQDADVVMMLSRLPAHEREGRENVIRVNIAKQRNGPTGYFDLLFEREIQRFRNLSGDGIAEPLPGDDGAPPPDDDFGYDDEYFEEDDTPF